MHRALAGAVAALREKPRGRVPRPLAEATLRRELVRLRRENARLRARVDSTEQLLTVAGGLLQGRLRPGKRQGRTRGSPRRGARHEDGDPERRRQRLLAGVAAMRRLGLKATAAATLAGVHPATLRRWRRRGAAVRAPRPPCAMTATGAVRAAEAASSAEALVRQLHGLIGAAALSRSVSGLSRRTAAWLKARTLAAMERERKAALRHVVLTPPGVMRGLDAMHFAAPGGRQYALIGADAAVPYRTSVTVGRHYDTALVLEAVARDLQDGGAPLVLRLDRARAHDVPAVRELLCSHGVLLLHGPPHYPSYYGQLERQNREHRAWMVGVPLLDAARLQDCLTEMLEAVNGLWRRRTLRWQTAAEAWRARPRLDVDRNALREEVRDRAQRIAWSLQRRGQPADLAERLAIERTLERKGYLRQEVGAWC